MKRCDKCGKESDNYVEWFQTVTCRECWDPKMKKITRKSDHIKAIVPFESDNDNRYQLYKDE
jgi:hypothetical protein